MTWPKISIIILNWNGKEITKNLISSILKKTDYPRAKMKIIVVDNGSKDGSVEYLKKKFGRNIDILPLDKNYGYSIGINKGIEYALKKYNPDYFLFLNNDMLIVDSLWIKKMLEPFKYNKKIMSVGCNLIFPDGKLQYEGIRKFSRIFLPFEVSARNYPSYEREWSLVYVGIGAPMIIKREAIDIIGYFDTVFTPSSSEEIDYLIRIKKSGFFNAYCYNTKVIHFLSLTWKRFPNFYRFWLVKRNIFILHLKHFKRFLVLVLLGQILATIIDKRDDLKPFSISNIKIRDFCAICLKYLIKALFDAIRIYCSKNKYYFIENEIYKINL
jgi:GT2 family glycosyltransferase